MPVRTRTAANEPAPTSRLWRNLADRWVASWSAGGWAVMTPLFVVAFVGALLGRNLHRWSQESILLIESGIPLLLVSCVVAVILVPLCVRFGRVAVVALVIAMLGVAGMNVWGFRAADPSKQTPTFHMRSSQDLAPLGVELGWYNHWRPYRFYALMHDVMRGSRILARPPAQPLCNSFDGLFHPYYLRYMAEVTVVDQADLDDPLTDEEYAALAPTLTEPILDVNTLLHWRIAVTPGPMKDTYRAMRHGDESILVRESALSERRGR